MWKLAACAAIAVSMSTCAYAPAYAAKHPKPRPAHKEEAAPANCGKVLDVTASLKKHGLTPIHAGFVNDHLLLTIYATPDNKIWAEVSITDRGVACIVVSGNTWMSAQPKFPYAAGRSDQ